MVLKNQSYGSKDGEYFLCLVKNCLVLIMVRSGVYHTIGLSKNNLREKLKNDFIVITDRYLDSTLAYQGYGRNIDKSIINELNKFSTENLYPDITFLLDLKVEEANKRTKKRKDTSNKDQILKFENEENIFHQKIRDGFLKIAKNNKDRINIIDASLDQKEILKLIIEKVLRKLNL